MVDMASVMGNLRGLGFFDFILPFVLFFAVIHAIILKSGVFGADKRVSTIISAAVAFFIIAFTPLGGTAAYYSTLFGVGGVIIGVLLVLVLLGGVLGYSPQTLFETVAGKTLIAIVVLVLAFLAFQSTALGVSLGTLTIGSDTITLLAVLVFILLVMYYAESGGGGGGDSSSAQKPASGHG